MANEMFELLVKINGDSAGAKASLEELKADAVQLDAKLATMDVGSKAFEETTVKAKAYGRAIQELEQPINRLSTSNRAAQNTAMNVSRVIQDMPYGLMGVANNVDMLMESWQRLRAENSSVKTTFQALMSSMMGPTGIMMAVSAVMALAIAFGKPLMQAIKGREDDVDDLRTKLEGLQQYKNFELTVKIAGLSGIARIKAQVEQLAKTRDYLTKSIAVDEKVDSAVKAREAERWKLRLTETNTSSRPDPFAEKEKAAASAIAEQTALYTGHANEVKAGSSFGKLDEMLLTKYGKMTQKAALDLIALNATRQKYDAQLVNLKEEEAKAAKDDFEKGKSTHVSRSALNAAQKQLDEAAKKGEEERIKIQESEDILYRSMLSDVDHMVLKTADDFKKANEKLHSGDLGEHFDELVKTLDTIISLSLDEKVKAELQVIRKKIADGQPLSHENEKLLVDKAGLSKGEAEFLGQETEFDANTKSKKRRKRLDDKQPLESVDDLKKKYKENNADIGDNFEKTAVQAFDSATNQFSAQLSRAILEGGQSFSDVLGNVATQFGESLLSFVIQALTEKAAMSFLSVIGLAEGSVGAPPGYTWVGEKGPELVRFRGGEEVVPTNQVHNRLNNLYNAGASAQSAQSIFDTTGIIQALHTQTKALIKDRLNYEITMNGMTQIARATKAKETQIKRYTGL